MTLILFYTLTLLVMWECILVQFCPPPAFGALPLFSRSSLNVQVLTLEKFNHTQVLKTEVMNQLVQVVAKIGNPWLAAVLTMLRITWLSNLSGLHKHILAMILIAYFGHDVCRRVLTHYGHAKIKNMICTWGEISRKLISTQSTACF